MRNAHPYPLPAHAIDDYRHPADWHGLHHARRHGGEILAGNGYIAIRARKGAWLDEEFQPATAEFLSRFGKLPWACFEALADCWRPLDSQRGRIFERGQLGLWIESRQGIRLSPTPVWLVNRGRFRLSLIQRVAMLPRAEVFTGHADPSAPLFFRFSGGIGMIAHDRRLDSHSAELFPPARDLWSGEILPTPRRPKPSFVMPGKPWPPPDLSEY